MKNYKFIKLLEATRKPIVVDGVKVSGELCWMIKKPSKIEVFMPNNRHLVFKEMHMPYKLFNKLTDGGGSHGSSYSYKTGECELYGTEDFIKNRINKFKIKITPTVSKVIDVDWDIDLMQRWTGRFWTKKWLKWYTDLLKKGNIDYTTKKNEMRWG